MSLFLLIALSYLAGSIPFGLLLTRYAGLGDIRKIGSGNIGATNALRTGNKKIAALTLFLDAFKGTLPVFIAYAYFDNQNAVYIAGFSAILGHIFPLWLCFQGGKGIATALGVYCVLHPPLTVIIVCIWLLVAKIWHISALSALVAFSIAPLCAAAFVWLNKGSEFLIYFSGTVSLLIFYTHRQNIQRLLSGKEARFKNPK